MLPTLLRIEGEPCLNAAERIAEPSISFSLRYKRNYPFRNQHVAWRSDISLQSICDDKEVLQSNFLQKIRNSPDYRDMPEEEAIKVSPRIRCLAYHLLLIGCSLLTGSASTHS